MLKKFLFVCTTDSMIWNFLIPHIRFLQARNHIVDCACAETGFYFKELEDRFRLTVHKIDFQRSPYQVKNIMCLKELVMLIRKNHYDIIHCHEPVGGVMGRVAGRICGKKVIYTAHGFHFYKGAPLINRMLYETVERFLARFTDVLITINQEDYKAAQTFHLAKGGKSFFIRGIGLDVNAFRQTKVDVELKRAEFGIGRDQFVVLSVGEFIKRKNYEVALRAFAKADLPNAIYLICGEGELRARLELLAKELKISRQVIFAGFRKDIKEIVQIADIFLFPTLQEGLGLAAIEGMSAGLPIVASNVRGVNEFLVEGKSGYGLSPLDVDGFSSAIQKLACQRELVEQIGQFNRKHIETFDINKILLQMDSIYEEMRVL